MVMHKFRLLFAAIAVLVVAAPASLLAAEPATETAEERAYLHSAEWHQDWEPCFKDRPADRIVAMRMLDVVVGFHDYRQTAGTGGKAKTSRATAEEMAAWIGSARVKQMIDDIELLANHGCGVAQAGFALFYWVGFGPIRADGTELLKWLMLAQEAGYEAARNGLESFMPDYTPEEIAKARALAEAWRPSD